MTSILGPTRMMCDLANHLLSNHRLNSFHKRVVVFWIIMLKKLRARRAEERAGALKNIPHRQN